MEELRWVKVARVGEVAPGGLKRAQIDALTTVTLVNLDGEYHALSGTCSHSRFPLWAGRIREGRLVCPGHGWQFDPRTGAVLLPRDGTPVRTFPVRVDGDDVYVGWAPGRPTAR